MIFIDSNVRGRIRATCSHCKWEHIWSPSLSTGAKVNVLELAKVGVQHDVDEHGK